MDCSTGPMFRTLVNSFLTSWALGWKPGRRTASPTGDQQHLPSGHHVLSTALLLLFFFFFGRTTWHAGILISQPGIEPASPAVEALSLNHWIAREVLLLLLLTSQLPQYPVLQIRNVRSEKSTELPRV